MNLKPMQLFICSLRAQFCQEVVNKQLLSCFNRSCLLSNPCPPPPILNRQYHDGLNTNQSQTKNMCPFYIVFQVLKVLLIKICKIPCIVHDTQPVVLSLGVYQLLHQQISFFTNFPFFHWKPAKKVGVVMWQNLGQIRSSVMNKVLKQALSIGFFYILHEEYLLKY